MTSVNPKYIIALIVVVAFVGVLKVMNPDKKYSTREFWQLANLESVSQVPDKALKAGNKNGSVLMWAAIGASDPRIIRALVERGAQVNESDSIFSGTPITGAAGYSRNPEIIRELVNLGADINKKVNNDETALLIAAQYNTNKGIIETLVSLGAKLDDKTAQGKSALDLAKENNNKTAEEALMALMNKN
ncbi:MAG: ankyrin repeat domain-containing protein [Sulfuricaulis sp.]|nr:ankyrin repeat domain-containing protein [Sulfuricaulis sp.]